MYEAIRSYGFAAIQLKRISLEVGYFPASLVYDEYSRRRIPGIQIEFPETFEASCRYRAQIQCGRTGAADSMRSQSDLMIKEDVWIFVAFMTGKAGRNQAFA